jgi:ribosomal protein S27AE
MATPGVGEDIEDTCTRCGDTWHVVMAKVGDRIAKVVCKRCGSQHNFRSGEAAAAPAASGGATAGGRRRTLSRRPSSLPAEPEARPMPQFDPTKPPRSYAPRESYAPGERIAHATFGIGVVSALPGPGKVEVVFPGGVRVLACAKEESSLQRPTHADHVPISDRPPGRSDS